MTKFLQLSFQGLSLGAVYSLIAIGFVIVFKGSRVFNFGHAEFVMVAAFIVVSLAALTSYGVAVGVAVAVMVALALLAERFILRPMLGRSFFSIVLVTLGIAIMARSVAQMIWGHQSRGYADPIGRQVVRVGDVVFAQTGLWTLAISALLLAALGWFYQRTPYGLALRATAAHQEAALAQGIDVRVMFALSWGIAGVLAVAGGVFLGAFPRTVHPEMGFVALNALPAIIIGGFDSLAGGVIGGVLIGLVQVLGAGYLSEYGGGRLHEVLPYVLMLVVLLVRPYGLFGTPQIERV